jgi:hypothetical protein
MESRVGKGRRLEVYWFTVSYKQVLLWTTVILLVLSFGGFAFFKEYVVEKYSSFLESDKVAKAGTQLRSGRFVNITGSVKVKKSNAVQWINADPQTLLEAGDYIQTSSDSYALIIFEGTNYKMKPDSLIVVQENSEDPRTSTKKVSVRVSSGAIDMSTARREVSQSTSEVSAASATAQVDHDSRMAVESDPSSKSANFSVQKGVARISRGKETYSLGPYEKVTVDPAKLVKEKIMAPPELLTPNHVRPVITREGMNSKVEFSWNPVSQAAAYKIRISNSSIFSQVLREEVVRNKNSYVTSGLEEGTYYWAVTSIDAKNSNSRESDPNKFTLINKTGNSRESVVYLSILQVTQISNIFEIIGRTDPGASVMINEEPVPLMSGDGTFKHFTSPFPEKGKNLITITAQDRSGNSKTIKREVYIE